MSAITEAANSVSLPVVQKPAAFHFTPIEWADLSLNLLRAITTRDCWALKGDVVPEGTPGAKLIKAGTTGWFCVHVSEGCRNCYSETMNIRFGCGLNYKAQYLKSGLVKVVLDEQRLEAMLKWKIPKGFKSKVDGSDRPKCFPFDMTDLAGDWVAFEMLDRIFAAMALRSDIDFMLLTKRIERMAEYLTAEIPLVTRESEVASRAEFDGKIVWDARGSDRNNYQSIAGGSRGRDFSNRRVWPGWPLPNVLIGCSIENRKALHRLDDLRRCPAAAHFVSFEPLLEDLGDIDLKHVEFAIGGCESGSSRRHIHDDAYGEILAQCEVAGVAYFQKQMEVDGKVTGDISQFPIQLRVREFPKSAKPVMA